MTEAEYRDELARMTPAQKCVVAISLYTGESGMKNALQRGQSIDFKAELKHALNTHTNTFWDELIKEIYP